MKKTSLATLFTAAVFTLPIATASAQEVVVKLGTSAPSGSPWHNLLKEAAQKWSEVSGGKVKLKLFPGGVMGNEGDMVKKMRNGILQAAALSTIGLHEIVPDTQALDIPLLVNDFKQRECVLEKMAPKLEKLLEQKGYVVLTWSEIGFTRFFSTEARPDITQIRDSKLFCWEGDPASNQAWIAGGFHTVVLSAPDIIPSLQTGMIETFVYPPTVVLSIGGHNKAKYMMDMLWSTLTGATIVEKKTWERIPTDLQPKLMKIFRDKGVQIVQEARKMEDDSLAKMKAQGLQVVHMTDVPEWHKAVTKVQGSIRDKVVPAASFDDAFKMAKECGAKH